MSARMRMCTLGSLPGLAARQHSPASPLWPPFVGCQLFRSTLRSQVRGCKPREQRAVHTCVAPGARTLLPATSLSFPASRVHAGENVSTAAELVSGEGWLGMPSPVTVSIPRHPRSLRALLAFRSFVFSYFLLFFVWLLSNQP